MDVKTARDMFIRGYSITDIATACGVSRQSIYAAKARAKAAGEDWDELALAKNREQSNTIKSEQGFILALIESFERAFSQMQELPPQERLEILKNYTQTYYSLKAPLKTDLKAQMLDAASRAINEIADLATKKKCDAVTEFLAANADEILRRVLKQ
ncbi:DUF1804 family protein [uncultured Campylobacter sp.]|uniref:DUF1804 family protein n=1 Tax=uncultured Campylobacter sp. TaxID=218934 RepID=UPI002628C633|nr:DUF1804 family protein [uncultured Campylobacter sp.]